MLTEPQTTPPTRHLRIMYGVLVGILFGTTFNFGFLHNTPELALIVGNVFAYLVSPKQKLFLKLKEKVEVGPGIYDFIFDKDKNFNFSAGQYLEWTLAHPKSDLRGVRRYFTIASSPTEDTLRLGAKFYEPASTFKQHLMKLNVGDALVATQLSGDFTLPKDPQEKLVFIAGGIGITPFRSMVKYLKDINEMRDIILFYCNKTEDEIVYKEIFDNYILSRTFIHTHDDTGEYFLGCLHDIQNWRTGPLFL
jgi:ferredoxin-NADP reductase